MTTPSPRPRTAVGINTALSHIDPGARKVNECTGDFSPTTDLPFADIRPVQVQKDTPSRVGADTVQSTGINVRKRPTCGYPLCYGHKQILSMANLFRRSANLDGSLATLLWLVPLDWSENAERLPHPMPILLRQDGLTCRWPIAQRRVRPPRHLFFRHKPSVEGRLTN